MTDFFKWDFIGLWSILAAGAAVKGLDYKLRQKRDNGGKDQEVRREDR